MTKPLQILSVCLIFALAIPVAVAEVSVATLVRLNASGGVTLGPDGFLYASDFGPLLGPTAEPTNVYRINPDTGEYSVFASGFDGASGAAFDSAGNFYQAEPRGNRITRIAPDGSRSVVASGLNTPIGVQVDRDGHVVVSNCAGSEILRIDDMGHASVLARDAELMQCPNGLTQDSLGNFYAVTFGAGNVLKITPTGELSVLAELPVLTGGPSPVGLGHITFVNGKLYVTAIGVGVIYSVTLDGAVAEIAGTAFAFSNLDGPGSAATFSKPNGIAANADGSVLYINVSEPTWVANPTGLHPASIRMITGF